MSWLEGLAEPDWRDFHSDSEVQNIAKSALELLKEHETNLICNLLGGEPYEVYCKECRMVICRLGKGDDMNTVKGVFTHCPNCGRKVKWE